jgi:ribonucleoside-diphosphate reductase alpha chain
MQYKDGKNLLSEIKFLEGYSRKENGIQENWPMAVNRIMNMHREFYKDRMTPELENIINEIELAYRSKIFLGSQRALQFGGEQLNPNVCPEPKV